MSADSAAATEPTAVLHLSPSCVSKLNQIRAREGAESTALRVLVEGGGCSGFQYKFSLEQTDAAAASSPTSADDDRVFVDVAGSGAKVVIDEASLEFLAGSTVDYHTELIRSGFRVTDIPLADGGCSCGASFSIKID